MARSLDSTIVSNSEDPREAEGLVVPFRGAVELAEQDARSEPGMAEPVRIDAEGEQVPRIVAVQPEIRQSVQGARDGNVPRTGRLDPGDDRVHQRQLVRQLPHTLFQRLR